MSSLNVVVLPAEAPLRNKLYILFIPEVSQLLILSSVRDKVPAIIASAQSDVLLGDDGLSAGKS